MQIEIAKHARMSERGSSLLRLIQNNDMPLLDLLVREAVQNSLDASKPGKGYTGVDFNVIDFNPQALSKELEGITENLNTKFSDEVYQLIEVRDTNTSGLTGPIHHEDVKDNQFGNLLKLIYEISMPQQQEGAGGSWGLGKTVYFRIGIGLVIYYSQIENEDGDYESRMAACLVEDENDPDALIDAGDDSLKSPKYFYHSLLYPPKVLPLLMIRFTVVVRTVKRSVICLFIQKSIFLWTDTFNFTKKFRKIFS